MNRRYRTSDERHFSRPLLCGAALWIAIAAVRPAHATPVGTIFSGTAAADAASTYWNPAAMTLLKGTHTLLHGAFSIIQVDYQRDTPSGFDGSSFPKATSSLASVDPTFGLVTDFGLEDFRFGIGASIPWADGANWKESYGGRPSSTRYHGLEPRVGQFFITPSAAYRINKYISIGIGLDISGFLVHHEFLVDFGARINERVCRSITGDLSANPVSCPPVAALEDPALAGRVNVNGFGWGAGVFAGLLITPVPWMRLGIGIHGNAGTISAPTDISVSTPSAVTDLVKNFPAINPVPIAGRGTLDYNTPIIVTAGIEAAITRKLNLGLDMHWMHLSSTSVIAGLVNRKTTDLIDRDILTIKGRSDGVTMAFRGAYRVLEILNAGLRFEYASNNRPEEFVTPTSIDTHKISIHAGVSWQLTEWLSLIIEAAHFVLLARTINNSRFGQNISPSSTVERGFALPSPTGRYTLSAERFAIGLNFHF